MSLVSTQLVAPSTVLRWSTSGPSVEGLVWFFTKTLSPTWKEKMKSDKSKSKIYQLRFVPLFTTIRKSLKLNCFIEFLNSSWTLTLSSFFFSSCRDDTSAKATFFQHLVEDRTDSASSYYEFLQHVQQQMSKQAPITQRQTSGGSNPQTRER